MNRLIYTLFERSLADTLMQERTLTCQSATSDAFDALSNRMYSPFRTQMCILREKKMYVSTAA